MGRLSPFIDIATFVLTLYVLTFLMPNDAAPVQDAAASRYANEKGCYFMNQHYETGHEIETNDPCMNCTCTGSAMMCYLRICPFIKPLGESCKMEKHVGDCCPKYWCPEVYPRVKAPRPDTGAKGCYLDGSYYEEGSRLPVDPLNPCHACYCIRNVSVCTNETCELHIPGCYPRYKIGSCCPASYACTDEAATTIPPTALESETPAPGCKVDDMLYEDGVEVPSNETCKKCYCMRHQIMCTAIECTAPGTNCVAHEVLDGQCCPEKYDCPEDTQISEFATTHMISTEEEFANLTETPTPSIMTSSTPVSLSAEEKDFSTKDTSVTTESDQMYSTTKGIRRIDDEVLTIVPDLEAEALTTTEGTLMTVSGPRIPKITEIPEDMFTKPRVTSRPIFYPSRPIPGEGICRHENRTYQNREKIESSDPCLENCTCINSVVKCDIKECVLGPPPVAKRHQKCKLKQLDNECCPYYVCDTLSSNDTEDLLDDIVKDDLDTTTMHAETTKGVTTVSEKITPSVGVFSQTTSEIDITSKIDEKTATTPTDIEKPLSTTTAEKALETTIKSIDESTTRKSTMIEKEAEIATTVPIVEADMKETQFSTEKISTAAGDTKPTSGFETSVTQSSTELKDFTEARHQAETFSTDSSTKKEDETEIFTEQSKTTLEIKTTEELKKITSQIPTKEGVMETTDTHKIEDVTSSSTEFDVEPMSTSYLSSEFSTEREPTTFKERTTEKSEISSTTLLTEEKEVKTTHGESITTSPLEDKTTSAFMTVDEKEQAKVTEGESLITSETMPDIESKLTSDTILETQTITTPSSKDDREKTTTVSQKSETKLETTMTDELKKITTTLPTAEKEAETMFTPQKESISTTEALLYSDAVTMVPNITEAEKSTTVTKETKSELEAKLTKEMLEITTPLPTKDTEAEVTSDKDIVSTTAEILEAETVKMATGVTEMEKITTLTEESKTGLETKSTDETEITTTSIPDKGEDIEVKVSSEKDIVPTTTEILEAETVKITPGITEMEKITTVTEESKTALETKSTDGTEITTTSLPAKEQDIEVKVSSEKDIVPTTTEILEAETDKITPGITEMEKITTVTEESKTELETKSTGGTEITTTSLPAKEKDVLPTTAEMLEAEIVKMTPDVTEMEKISTITEESKTGLETESTDETEITTTSLSDKGEDIEVKVSSEKDIVPTTAEMLESETAKMTTDITEMRKITTVTEESKTELKTKSTDGTEITTASLPAKVTEDKVTMFKPETVTMPSSIDEMGKTTTIDEKETKTTDHIEKIFTSTTTKEKDTEGKSTPKMELENITTNIFGAETSPSSIITTPKEQTQIAEEISHATTDGKTTEESISTTLQTDEKEILISEKDSKSTTTKIAFETETDVTLQSIEETERTPIVMEGSKLTDAESKTTQKMEDITTELSTEEKGVESTGTSVEKTKFTTEAIVTEEKELPGITKESHSTLERKTTEALMPTHMLTEIKKEEDDIVKGVELTTKAISETEAVTTLPSIEEKEKVLNMTESSTTFTVTKPTETAETFTAIAEEETETKISSKEQSDTATDTVSDTLPTLVTLAEKDQHGIIEDDSHVTLEMETTKEVVTKQLPKEEIEKQTKVSPEELGKSTAVERFETPTISTPLSSAEKEETSIDIETSKTAAETKTTDEVISISTLLSTEEKDKSTTVTHEDEFKISTATPFDSETTSLLLTTKEKDQPMITDHSETADEQIITKEVIDKTTISSTEEKDLEGEETSAEVDKSTVAIALRTTRPTDEKEQSEIAEEDRTDISETKTTEKIETTSVRLPTEKKEVDIKVTSGEPSQTVTQTKEPEEVKIISTLLSIDKNETEIGKTTLEVPKTTTEMFFDVASVSTPFATDEKEQTSEEIPLDVQTKTTTVYPASEEEIKGTEPVVFDKETSLASLTTDAIQKFDNKTEEEEQTSKDLKTTEEIAIVTMHVATDKTKAEATSVEESVSTTASIFKSENETSSLGTKEKDEVSIFTEASPIATDTETIEDMKITFKQLPTEKEELEKDTGEITKSTTVTVFETETSPTPFITEKKKGITKATPVAFETEETEVTGMDSTQMKTDEEEIDIKTTPKEMTETSKIVSLDAETMPTSKTTEGKGETVITKSTIYPEFGEKTTEIQTPVTSQVPTEKKEIAVTSLEMEKSTTAFVLESETLLPSQSSEITDGTVITEMSQITKEPITASTKFSTTHVSTEKKEAEEITSKEGVETSTLTTSKKETLSTLQPLDETEKSMITEKETVSETGATETIKTTTTQLPKEEIHVDEITTPEVPGKSTLTTIFEKETFSTQPSIEEKEETAIISQTSPSVPELKTTEKADRVTIQSFTDKKELEFSVTEKEKAKVTTDSILEAETFETSASSVTVEEKEAKTTEELNKTSVETGITEGIKIATSKIPTEEMVSEITFVEAIESTTAPVSEAELSPVSFSTEEKDKTSIISEVNQTTTELSTTEEIKSIHTHEDESTTAATSESDAIFTSVSVGEKEVSKITEEAQAETETETAKTVKGETTFLPIGVTEVKLSPEEADKFTTTPFDVGNFSTLMSTEEQKESEITEEDQQTASEAKSTVQFPEETTKTKIEFTLPEATKTTSISPTTIEEEKTSFVTEEKRPTFSPKTTEQTKLATTKFAIDDKEDEMRISSTIKDETTPISISESVSTTIKDKEPSTSETIEEKTRSTSHTETKVSTTRLPTDAKVTEIQLTSKDIEMSTMATVLDGETLSSSIGTDGKEEASTEKIKTTFTGEKFTDEVKRTTTEISTKTETEKKQEEPKITTKSVFEHETVLTSITLDEAIKTSEITESSRISGESESTDEIDRTTTQLETDKKDLEEKVPEDKITLFTLDAETVPTFVTTEEKEEVKIIEDGDKIWKTNATAEEKITTTQLPLKEKVTDISFKELDESTTASSFQTTFSTSFSTQEKDETTAKTQPESETKTDEIHTMISSSLPPDDIESKAEGFTEKENTSRVTTTLEPITLVSEKELLPDTDLKTDATPLSTAKETSRIDEISSETTYDSKSTDASPTDVTSKTATEAALLVPKETKFPIITVTDDIKDTSANVTTTITPSFKDKTDTVTANISETVLSETMSPGISLETITEITEKLPTEIKWSPPLFSTVTSTSVPISSIDDKFKITVMDIVIPEQEITDERFKTSTDFKTATSVGLKETTESKTSESASSEFTDKHLITSLATDEADMFSSTTKHISPATDSTEKSVPSETVELLKDTKISEQDITTKIITEKITTVKPKVDQTSISTSTDSFDGITSGITETSTDLPEQTIIEEQTEKSRITGFTTSSPAGTKIITIKLDAEPTDTEVAPQQFTDFDKISSHLPTQKPSLNMTEETTLRPFSPISTVGFDSFPENITLITKFTETTELESQTKAEETGTQSGKVALDVSTLKPSTDEVTAKIKEEESPLSVRTDIPKTTLDEIVFKSTETPISTVHSEKITTRVPILTEKMDAIDVLTSTIVPELVYETKADKTVNQTTSILKTTTAESILPREKIHTTTISTEEDLGKEVTKGIDHTILETDIVTDNLFTPMKHIPDSLIREETTIHTAETEKTTLSPSDEVTEIFKNVTETQQFSDQDAEVAVSTSLPFTEISIDKITTQATPLRDKTTAKTLIEEELKTSTLSDKESTKEEISTTLDTKIEIHTSPKTTESEIITEEQIILSTPSVHGISTTRSSDISTGVPVELETETSSVSVLTSSKEDASETSILDEENEILARKPTVSETKDIDKLTSTESPKTMESELMLDSKITATDSSLDTTTEKVPELTTVYDGETSTLQTAVKTFPTSDLLSTEKHTTVLPIKETDILSVTADTTKEESETTLKTKLFAETTTLRINDTIDESTLRPERTDATIFDEMQTTTVMTEKPVKEEEILDTHTLSELSTFKSSTTVADKTAFSTKLPEEQEQKDTFTDGLVSLSTPESGTIKQTIELDTTTASPKTSFKADFETSTQFATTGTSKEETKEVFSSTEKTTTASSLGEEKSSVKLESIDKEEFTTLSEHDAETPSVSTEASLSIQDRETTKVISSSTTIPEEIVAKTVSSEIEPTTQDRMLETESPQTQDFESTKTSVHADVSKFTEISRMNETTDISKKDMGTTQSILEMPTTISSSKETELKEDLGTTSISEAALTTKKDSDVTNLQTSTFSDLFTEKVSETTSDIIKETVSETETKQASEKDLLTSTSKLHVPDLTTDKFAVTTKSTTEALETIKTEIPFQTFEAEEKDTSEPYFTSAKEEEKVVVTKTFDSQTTSETELKTDMATTLFVPSVKPSTLPSDPFKTISPETEETLETKLSTSEAETTSTEHSVITEETISSNATFAADAMIKPETTTFEPSKSFAETHTSSFTSPDDSISKTTLTVIPTNVTVPSTTASDIVTKQDISSVTLRPKSTEEVITFEDQQISKTTSRKPIIDSEIETKIDKEFTSETEFGSSTVSTIVPHDFTSSKKQDFTTESIHSTLLEKADASITSLMEFTSAVAEKTDLASTTEKSKQDSLPPEDEISSAEESVKEITEEEKIIPTTIEKMVTTTFSLQNKTLTTAEEFEEKTESTLATDFDGKTSEPGAASEAEASTFQAETTVVFKEDKTTSLKDMSPKELTTEKTTFISKETETPTTKLDTSISTEAALTTEKATQLPTKVPDITTEDNKTSLKPVTDAKIAEEISTTLISSKLPTTTVKTELITETEATESLSPRVQEITTMPTSKSADAFTEITLKPETPKTEISKFSEMTTEKTTTLEDKFISTQPEKSIDITEESLETRTTFKDELTTKEMVSEMPKHFTEEKEDMSSEGGETTSEFERSSTSSESSTTVRVPVIFDTAETKEVDFTVSVATEDRDSETSISHITEKFPEVSESTSSSATTISPKVVTEEITTLRPTMITDLGRKAFVSEAEGTTSTITEQYTTSRTSEDDELLTKDECVVNGISYNDGEAITTVDPCEKCHCSLGEINCFKILCKLPKENCIPKLNSTSECCPSSYECPKEDEENASIITSHSVTEKDFTTPIPISFMFSTTPESISSTLLITKSGEDIKEEKDTAAPTSETDSSPITDKIVTSTELDISVPTVTTKKVSISDTTDMRDIKSTTQSKISETTSDISVKEIKFSEPDFEISRETETSLSEDDLIFSTKEPKEIFESQEPTTISIEGEESSEITSEKSATDAALVPSTDKKDGQITEVTKQPTETPTTFDTIRTTFADIHKEEADEKHTLFESTTIITSKSDDEITKLPDLTTILSTSSTPKSTLKTDIKTADSVTSELTTITTEKPSKEVMTETTEKISTKEATTSFDKTSTIKIFEANDKDEPMFAETVTAESPGDRITESTKTSRTTSVREDMTTTHMPSKLPKLDDIFTSTDPTVTETEHIKKFTTDVEPTIKSEIMPTEFSMIAETDAEDILKDSNVTLIPEGEVSIDVKSSTISTTHEIDDRVTSLPEKEITSLETVNKTTEGITLLTTLGLLPTKKFDTDIVKDTEVPQTAKSLLTTSKFEDETSSITLKPVTEEISFKERTDLDIDKYNITLPPIQTISTIQEEKTSDYEIETEVFEASKAIDSLDQIGTVSTPKKETELSTISTTSISGDTSAVTLTPEDTRASNKSSSIGGEFAGAFSPVQEATTMPPKKITDHKITTEVPETVETITSLDKEETLITRVNETEFPTVSTTSTPISTVTEFGEKSEKPETPSTITDKIFTFVSTRFTDMMKGITEFTTTKADTEAMDLSEKESMTVSPFDISTKESKTMTPLVSLAHRTDLDLDQTTKEGEIVQEAEAAKSVTKGVFTTFCDEVTTSKLDMETGKDTESTPHKLEGTPQAVTPISTSATSLSESEITTKFILEPTKIADGESTEIFEEKTQAGVSEIIRDVTSSEIITDSVDIEKSSSVVPEVTTPSQVRETAFITEKKPGDISSITTILPKTVPEAISRVTLSQDETSPVHITEETRMTEPTITDEITSPKTEERTISSLSTEELSSKTPKIEMESKATIFTSETKPTTVISTTERGKISFIDETEIASRATRKDVELEVTPSSFTKIEVDSTVLPTNISTLEENITVHELNMSSESTKPISVTPISDLPIIVGETTIKHLESLATSLDSETEKSSAETLSMQNETVSTTPEIRQKEVITTPIPVIKNESKTTVGEVFTTEKETELPTESLNITTELPLMKTTFKEASSSIVEDDETMKPPTRLPIVTEGIETTTAPSTSESSLITKAIMTTQKEPQNLTQQITSETTSPVKLPTTESTSVSMETVDTTDKPQITTVVEDAETTVLTSDKFPQMETTVRPEVSTREELNVTDLVTKGFKSIETTTMKEEEDYIVDENTCIFEGRIFQSAEQIPRSDACEFCFCFRGDIICLQQSCPPPAPNCHQTTIPGYCCPRYECPVYVTSKNISALSRRKGNTPIIIQRRIDKREIRPVIEVKGCQYNGTFYEMGKTVTSASGPCLRCVCQEDGFMHCDPQRCKPQAPLMLKMNNNFFRRR